MALNNTTVGMVLDNTDGASSGIRSSKNSDFIKGNYSLSSGFTVKAISFTNLDLATTKVGSIIDGYTLQDGDAFCAAGQTDATKIGIYIASSTSSTIDQTSSIRYASGQYPTLFVQKGSANGGHLFAQTTASTVFDGTSFSVPLAFVDLDTNQNIVAPANISTYVAGTNLTNGQVVAIDPTGVNQVTLCDCTSGASLTYNRIGIVTQGGAAEATVKVAIGGEVTLPDSPFAQEDMGKTVYVDSTVVGGYSLTPPEIGSGLYFAPLGVVSGTNTIILSGSSAIATKI